MYAEHHHQRQQRVSAYEEHPPIGNQLERIRVLKSTASELAKLLAGLCPESRELYVAHTKLEEAVLWAEASIVRNEMLKPPGNPTHA